MGCLDNKQQESREALYQWLANGGVITHDHTGPVLSKKSGLSVFEGPECRSLFSWGEVKVLWKAAYEQLNTRMNEQPNWCGETSKEVRAVFNSVNVAIKEMEKRCLGGRPLLLLKADNVVGWQLQQTWEEVQKLASDSGMAKVKGSPALIKLREGLSVLYSIVVGGGVSWDSGYMQDLRGKLELVDLDSLEQEIPGAKSIVQKNFNFADMVMSTCYNRSTGKEPPIRQLKADKVCVVLPADVGAEAESHQLLKCQVVMGSRYSTELAEDARKSGGLRDSKTLMWVEGPRQINVEETMVKQGYTIIKGPCRTASRVPDEEVTPVRLGSRCTIS